ncbi:uncharacterized protein [Spinacia oleracea]|uniref:Uncharacterized protein n=1 Tax=Spinacia oleracea TaxID=3562 RepID=A0ABM3QKC4_SPIOL|nr:uncharacterized protein LOC130460148 [Spinacia oleracea]
MVNVECESYTLNFEFCSLHKTVLPEKENTLEYCLSYHYQDGSERVGEPNRGTTIGVFCSCSLILNSGKHASNKLDSEFRKNDPSNRKYKLRLRYEEDHVMP